VKRLIVVFFLSVTILFSLSCKPSIAADPLMVFCGAAFKRPMEDITKLYQQRTGGRVDVAYGNLSMLLSQILLSRQGDVLVAPSPEIMERALEKKVVESESIRNIAYLVPTINTRKGNPKNISGLKDLARPGIRVGLANPEIVYIGAVAAEIIENNLSGDEKIALQQNIVTYVEDFNKLATLIVLNHVDAIIGMHFLEGWYPDKVSTVKLKPAEVSRIGSAQAAVVTHTAKKAMAGSFIDFLASDEVRAIFRKYHYFGTTQEAFSWVGEAVPVKENVAPAKGGRTGR